MLKQRLGGSLLCGLLLVGCGAATPAPSAAATPEYAPTPFSAREIRVATRDGRQYTFAVHVKGKPAGRRILTFSNVTDVNATVSSHNTDLTGVSLGPVVSTEVTWEQLRMHARYGAASTTIREGSTTVGAGTFECMVYVVMARHSDGAETLSRLWFAKKLPGAPVRMSISRDGEPLFAMTLSRHTP